MKYTVFCFKDKQLGLYTVPSVSQLSDPEDLKDDVRAQIIKSDKRDIFKGKDLVCLGTYDNKTGLYDTGDPEFLLNCDEVISQAFDYERSKEN